MWATKVAPHQTLSFMKLAGGPSANYYRKIESAPWSKISLYAVALAVPFTGSS